MLFLRRLTAPSTYVRRFTEVLLVLISVSTSVFLLAAALQCGLSHPWVIVDQKCSGWVGHFLHPISPKRHDTDEAAVYQMGNPSDRRQHHRTRNFCGSGMARVATTKEPQGQAGDCHLVRIQTTVRQPLSWSSDGHMHAPYTH